MTASPLVVGYSPESTCSNVDLPVLIYFSLILIFPAPPYLPLLFIPPPLGPIKPKHSPWSTVNARLFTATFVPAAPPRNIFVIPCTRTGRSFSIFFSSKLIFVSCGYSIYVRWDTADLVLSSATSAGSPIDIFLLRQILFQLLPLIFSSPSSFPPSLPLVLLLSIFSSILSSRFFLLFFLFSFLFSLLKYYLILEWPVTLWLLRRIGRWRGYPKRLINN